ncbi:MAG: DegT/DnrJ/EryC1/StrS family aminotransferase, partial [Pseudomonadales bacterium]
WNATRSGSFGRVGCFSTQTYKHLNSGEGGFLCTDDPEVIAKASNYINYANGNKASQQYLDKSVLEDPAIYPDDATMKNLFTHTADGPKYTRTMNRTWTRVKTGQ